jgi:hypothetical protein
MTGSAGCCAPAASGHAVAPPDEVPPPHAAYPKAKGSQANYSTVHRSKKRSLKSGQGQSRPRWSHRIGGLSPEGSDAARRL